MGKREISLTLGFVLLAAAGGGVIGSAINASPEDQGFGHAGSGLNGLFQRAQLAIVRVEAGSNNGTDGLRYTNDKQSSIGTGFFVSPTEVLTAGHVVYSSSRRVQPHRSPLFVRIPTGERFPAKLLAVEPHDDVALLSVSGDPHVRPLGFAVKRPTVGAPVVTVGSPGFELAALTAGFVSREEEAEEDNKGGYVLDTALDINATEGNSGSPVLNADGEVLGMILYYEGEDGAPLQLMRPSDVLRSDLSELRKQTDLSNPLDGSTLFGVHPELEREFELPYKRGIWVADVESKSALSEAGARTGDELLSVDGRRVGEVTEALQALLQRKPRAVTIEYSYGGLGALRKKVSLSVKASAAPG